MLMLDAFSRTWLQLIVVHTLETSAFLLLLFALNRLLPLRTAFRYGLMALGLAKLFVPPFLELPLPAGSQRALQFFLQPIVIEPIGQPGRAWAWQSWLLLLWIAVSICLLVLIIARHISLRARLRTCEPLLRLPVPLDKPGRLRVFVSRKVHSPLLTGLLRPALYLPADHRDWPPQHLQSVVAHELAHLSRRDLWVLALQNVALVLFGFNPLVWLLHRKLNHLRELRCDELAIRTTGIHAVEYSRLLIAFLEKQIRPHALSGISFAETRAGLRHRFEHLLQQHERGETGRRRLHFAALAVACFALIPLSWRCGAPVSAPSPPELAREGAGRVFVAYDTPPEPVRGFTAIQQALNYPEIARKAGIQGRVIVNILVSETGTIEATEVLQSLGNSGCDEAAIAAIKAAKWRPAMRRGTPVKVWVAIPVIFKLQ